MLRAILCFLTRTSKKVLSKGLLPSLILFPTIAWAANFQVEGSARLLSEIQGNKTMGLTTGNLTALHSFFRPILRPTLFVSDTFILVSEWSLLEATGLNDFPISGGATGTRPTTLLNTLPIRGYPLGVLQTTQAGLITPLRVNELYLRWDNDVLALNFGRQTRQWGLGMIYDDGTSSPFSNFKSVLDGIMVFLPLGSELQIEFGYFKSLESLFDEERDDGTHLYAQAVHQQVKSKLETGVFFELAILDTATAVSQAGAVGARRGGGSTSTFIIDGYGTIYPSSHLRLSSEIAYAEGKDPTTPFADTGWDDLTTYAGILTTEFLFPSIKFGVSGGYFRGDNNGTTDNSNTSFIFAHPNLSVGILLTRAAVGLTSSLTTSVYPYEAKVGYFENGTGLMFARPYSHFTFSETWSLDLDIPVAWAADLGPSFASRRSTFMGVEIDVKIRHVWDNLFETQLYGATLIPGGFFDDTTDALSSSLAYAIGFLGQLRF